MKKTIKILGALLITSSLCACTDNYDPGQRAIGVGLLVAGGGAAIGALAGGGRGAAIGALSGGVLGAGTGYITTPNRGYYQPSAPMQYGYPPQY